MRRGGPDGIWDSAPQRKRSSTQGRSQIKSPGGQEFHFPHFFLKFWSIILIFPIFMAIRVGDSPTREGPGYATGSTSKYK